ncbi:E3 SUMO-protein ligase PIAS2-like isoform X2 [Convolutriloba macropyga]|uniref:E3 SUMO-protein ligase PIAS2-like isoform X2 n=1 Tax=Convolutriloba macropyga TaxID=536237 RepID=UPI003F52693A
MSRNNAIREDLKAIVDNFRVSELVTVCTIAGVSRNGKKTELLSRIYNLIRDPVPHHVEKKIMELFKICFPNQPVPTPANSTTRQDSGATTRSSHNLGNFQIPKPPQAPGRPPADNNLIHSSHYSTTASVKRQPSGGTQQHSGNAPQYSALAPNAAGMDHPDVRYKVIPFYDVQDVIFKPLCLAAHNVNSTYQDAYFQFALSANQLDQIQKSPRVNVHGQNGSIVDKTYQVQVQMRFCLMETSCDQLDNYPPYINVRVNGKAVELPPVLPQSKAGQPPKRSPKPLNVTKYIKFDNQINHVQIQWTTEFARTWVCAVFLVKENDSSVLLQRLKSIGPRSADHTRALIKDKLKIDPDSEIAMTTLRISLNCPLGVCRMTLPVRSKQCTHVQCFDATFYVKMNEKRPCWQCPVCGKDAPFSELVLDGYFIEVLDSSTYDCTEIFCYDNGSWEPIDGDKKTFQTIGTPYQQNKSATSPAVGTDLTSPVKVEDSPNTHSENNSASMRRSSVSSATSKSAVATKEGPKEEKSKASAQAPVPEEQEEPPEVVDLCSDSDDEEPAQKEAPPARPVSAISLSSASPAESNPNNGSVPHPKESSPFPSPPLMPNHELQRAANHSQSERAYETRKRSLAQANSGSYLEEESSYAKSAPASQSRAFLNPPLVTSNLALGVGASSRGLPGSVVPPTVIPRPPVPTPTFLNDAAPMGSLSSASTDLYGRSKLNPNAAVFNPSYNSYAAIDPRTGFTGHHPQQQRDNNSAINSIGIPPPPSRPTSARSATNENYPQISNSFFPPPPMRPKEFNIIELE